MKKSDEIKKKVMEFKEKIKILEKQARDAENEDHLKLGSLAASFLSGEIQKNEFIMKAEELGFKNKMGDDNGSEGDV